MKEQYDFNGLPILTKADKHRKDMEYHEIKSRARAVLAELDKINNNKSLGRLFDLTDDCGAIKEWCDMDIHTGEFKVGVNNCYDENKMNTLLEEL